MAMAAKPIRTSQLLGEHNKPTELEVEANSRQSRLTRFYQSAGSRDKSADRLTSSTKKNYLVNSAMKSRSVSATPRTPSHYSSGINFLTLTTAEKPETKKWIQTETNKILEYLKLNNCELEKNFFQKNNPLKAMSTKQFIRIFNNFCKKLCGKRFNLSSDTDYTENFIKILSDLEYPYHQVTKSWLKTPCAPHTYTNLIQVYSWILPDDNNDNLIEEFKFFKISAEAFTAWNNFNEDEYEIIKEKMCGQYIQEHYQIESIKDLTDEIQILNSEIETLSNQNPILKRADELLQLENEYKQIQKIVLNLENTNISDEKELSKLKSDQKNEINYIEVINKNITELKKVLDIQTMSKEEYLKLVENVKQLNSEVNNYNEKITRIQDDTFKNEVCASRLIIHKNEIINKCNTLIETSIYANLNDENLLNYKIDKYNKKSTLKEIENFWKDFKFKQTKDYDCKINEVRALADKLELLEYQFKISNDNLKEIINDVAQTEALFLMQEKDYLKVCNINEKEINNLTSKAHISNLTNDELKNELANKKKYLIEFEKTNEVNWNEILRKSEEANEQKKKKLEKWEGFCDELEKVVSEMHENSDNDDDG